jgi:hypothetical protein
MFSRILKSAFAAAFLVAVAPLPDVAIAATAKKEEKAEQKQLTPQQQKMKTCAAKWGDEKKAKKVSGRKAYNEFMSKCLKD